MPPVEDRGARLVHEELGGSLQVGHQRVTDGAEFEGGATDPIGKRGSVESDAVTAVDLGLPVKRQVIRILADQNMRDEGLGRQTARDQPRGGRGLGNAVCAGPAGILGAAGDDDTELGRHDVEPF